MSDYLYFSNNLTDIKNHMLDYIVGCKSVLQQKVMASKENMDLQLPFLFSSQNKLRSSELEQYFGKFVNHTVWLWKTEAK